MTTPSTASPGTDPTPLTAADAARLEVVKDVVDELIDLTLNYRQSGHPGGSRSKVHFVLGTLLSRRDALGRAATLAHLRRPLRPLGRAHRAPRLRHPGHPQRGHAGAPRPRRRRALRLPRRRPLGADLGGPADASGTAAACRATRRWPARPCFFKANTGPSGHGMPVAAGEALALKMAGCPEVKVFVVEGEGGLTPGVTHETLNSAWGLGLGNLVFLVDWNDFGIDPRAASSVVYGTPEDWFGSHGWRTLGTPDGMAWEPVLRTALEAARGDNPAGLPTMAWFRTQKGRGYGKQDAASHGIPHALNSPAFWAVREGFMARYGVAYEGAGEPAPDDAGGAPGAGRRQPAAGALRADAGTRPLVRWLSDRLADLAASVPDAIPGCTLGGDTAAIFSDPVITDFRSYPAELYKRARARCSPTARPSAPGAPGSTPTPGSDYGRPLFIACSADLAESTNVAGFAKDFGELPGWGWYERDANPRGTVLPQEITEMTNAGILAGMASVNFADGPARVLRRLLGRLLDVRLVLVPQVRAAAPLQPDGPGQRAQAGQGPLDRRPLRTGDGGGLADPLRHLRDRRHAALPGGRGHRPAPLGAQRGAGGPRRRAGHRRAHRGPAPDAAAGRPSPTARRWASRRTSRPPAAPTSCAPSATGRRRMGTVFVQGTVPTANVVKILPELDRAGLNVKIVAAISPQLFRLQDAAYREATVSVADRWDAMAVTNGARRLMADWLSGPVAEEYTLCADRDDRWRTGGSVDEVMDEAGLGADQILAGIERFVREREGRLAQIRAIGEAVADR